MKRWFVSQQGKLKGPFTLAQLTAMIPAGNLKPEDMLRPEEGGSPTCANRVPGLFTSAEPESESAPVKPAPNVAVTAKPASPPPIPAESAVTSVPQSKAATAAAPHVARSGDRATTSGRSQYGMLIAAGVVAVLLLVCVLPVAGLGLVWVFRGNEKTTDAKGDAPLLVVKQEEKEESPPKPKGPPPMSPQVKEAVDKGTAHLKKRIMAHPAVNNVHDHLVGSVVLSGLALLEAGVPPDDPAVQKVLRTVRDAGPRVNLVYAAATFLFFLNRLDDAESLNAADKELARSLTLRIVAGQNQNGFWDYGTPPITPQEETDLLRRLDAKDYKPTTGGASNDPSATQFALLALWGSRRHGIPIDASVLAGAAHFQQTQEQGTWGYRGRGWQDSNTCAGLIALAMDKTLREDKKFRRVGGNDLAASPKADAQVAKAFEHLSKAISRKPLPKNSDGGKLFHADSHGDYYFLWCLERVAVIYDLKEIGGKDWYAWGSDAIVQNQRPDGSWVETHGDMNDTCFAILFLTRANLAKDLTESIRTRGGKAAIP